MCLDVDRLNLLSSAAATTEHQSLGSKSPHVVLDGCAQQARGLQIYIDRISHHYPATADIVDSKRPGLWKTDVTADMTLRSMTVALRYQSSASQESRHSASHQLTALAVAGQHQAQYPKGH